MKTKVLFILILTIIAVIFTGWLLIRDSSAPIVETIREGLPFGSGEDINIPPYQSSDEDAMGQTTFDENITNENKLFRISNTPVAGFVTILRGGRGVVRYVERATGHIFDVYLPNSDAPLEKIRVTNNTLPKIYEAYFHSDGSEVVLRSLDENSGVIRNITLTLTPPNTTSTSSIALHSISATNLRGGMDSVLPGTGNTLYYVLRDSSSIVSSSFTGTNLRTLFESAFDNWRLEKAGNNLLVYTKASVTAPGYAYLLNSSGGSLSKILGPLQGLTAVSNSNASRILYSYSEAGVTKLFIRNSRSESSEILPATLAEKCVWSNTNNVVFFCGTPTSNIGSNEPDNWYLGRSHFSDYIWRFDTASEIAQLISSPKTDFDIDLDVYKPKFSSNENYLIFINKRDLTLWAVKLD